MKSVSSLKSYIIIVIAICIGHTAFAVKLPGQEICLTKLNRIASHPLPWFEKIDFDATEQILAHGKIMRMMEIKTYLKSTGRAEGGSLPGLILFYEDGTRAIAKVDSFNSAYAEVGHYKLFKNVLKTPIVPPTVTRDLEPELRQFAKLLPESFLASFDTPLFSIQYFIDSPYDSKNMSPGEYFSLWNQVPLDELSNRAIGNFIFAYSDDKKEHVLFDGTGHIAQIDGESTLFFQQGEFGKRPFVQAGPVLKSAQKVYQGEPFPFGNIKTLKNPSLSDFKFALLGVVSEARIKEMWTDYSKNGVKGVDIVVWRNALWVRLRGYINFLPFKPETFPKETIETLQKITFNLLRENLSPQAYTDQHILDMLDRKEQVLKRYQVHFAEKN